MRIPSGVTDQYIYFIALDPVTGDRETGLSGFTVYRSRDGGAATAYTTPTVNETDATNMPGVYELLVDEDTTIAAGNDSEAYVLHITHASMLPVTREIELYRPKITAGNTLGVESDGDLTKVNTLDGHTAQTGDSFARIGATGSGLTSLAQASVLGALADAAAAGDPTASDTLVAYVKQIINTLEGTAGIPVYPAPADPANNVSLAEAIRAIRDDVTGIAGAAMRGTDNALLAASAPSNWSSMGIEADGHVHADMKEWLGVAPLALASQRVISDLRAIVGDSAAADILGSLMDGLVVAQVNDAAATSSAFAADGFTEATDDHFNGRLITFLTGALAGQQTDIIDYDAAGGAQGSQEFTVTALTEAPANDVFFIIH